jgi:hypothetical protein
MPNSQQHLQCRRTQDTARIRTMRGAISPVKKIPPEVLVDIFTRLAPDQMVLPPTTTSHPFTRAHVCGRWRSVVWTSPAISGSIQIEHIFNFGGIWGRTSVTSGMWGAIVHAAFDHVLSVTRGLLSVDASSDGAAAIFDLVLSHSHRFQSLVLVLNLPQHSLTHLEHIDITLDNHHLSSYNTSSSPLETLPNTRRVSFTSSRRRLNTLPLHLPWAQPREITMTRINIPQTAIHTALQHCPALLKCQFTVGTDTVPLSNTLILTLPSLEILNLSSCDTLDWDAFLQPFITPSLKDLTLSTSQATFQTITIPGRSLQMLPRADEVYVMYRTTQGIRLRVLFGASIHCDFLRDWLDHSSFRNQQNPSHTAPAAPDNPNGVYIRTAWGHFLTLLIL